MNRHYQSVARRAGFRCEYCHAPESVFNFAFEVEHIYPYLLGGADELENMCLACRSCNLFKSSHTQGLLHASAPAIRLFHPRLDSWQEHFDVELTTAEIVARTQVGEGTIGRLQMNRLQQLAARAMWMKLGIFP